MKTTFLLLKNYKGIFSLLLMLSCFVLPAKADYTIASGANINATAITGQSGTLTINGTLTLNSNVSLSNFTTVIINGPSGQIYWSNNSDLTFNSSVTITINNNALGLQPTTGNGNASQRLIIGTTIIAVSSDNASNAAFSFEEFNAAGGLPQFLISVSTNTVCSGSSFTATITPLNSTINYDCDWSIAGGAGTLSATASNNFNSPKTITITPSASGTYTVNCILYQAGDDDAIVTKTKTVTVNAQPAVPTSVTTSSASICVGSSINIKATSSGNTIQWYTVASAGTSIGSSASATNYSVTPSANTTYYAESKNASGCVSSTRASVSVTVSPNSAGGTVSGNANVCSGSNNTILSLTGNTGSVTRWESSTNNFATAGTIINNTTTSNTVTNLSATTYYRAVITSGACAAANSSVAVLTVSNAGTWLGVNTDWNSTLNWCNGTIPIASTNVTIPTGLTNYPVITGTAFANNITVATGGTASITVTGVFKIAGLLTSTNSVNASAGTIELAGSSAQTIRADNFTSATIANLKISNTLSSASAANPSVAINASGGTLKISGLVSFGSINNAYLQTNDQLTLLSTATATASIGDLTNNNVNTGNNVTGKVVIERYIPGRRAWRLLSAPVTVASQVKISASWQEGASRVTNPSSINSSNNPNPGYGTHVTYGSPATNGYDQGPNGNTNICYMTGTGWNGVPSATNNGATANSGYITDQPGYMLFVRGDRSTQLSSGTGAATTATVLRIKGNINNGQLSLPINTPLIIGSSKFRVLSNPYASSINFHKVVANSGNTGGGFSDAFYLWDPSITGSNGVGGWVALSYNSSTGLYDRNVSGSSISNNGDIQSGSAFLINYTGTSTSLQLKESNKSNSSNNTQFRPVGNVNQLRVNLLAKNTDNSISVNDGVLVSYDESYSDEVDNADMKKIANFAENLGIIRNDESLVIERRNSITGNDTINFRMTKMKQKNYQLEIGMKDLSMPDGTVAILQDKFLSSGKILTPAETNTYDFTINGNASSSNAERFKMIFKKITNFNAISAEEKTLSTVVKWKLNYEFYLDYYEIERSINGSIFTTEAKIPADSTQLNEYSWLDKSPAPGMYYYRIKAVAKNGATLYSEKAEIKIVNSKRGIYVYPNPVTGNNMQVRMNDLKPGTYHAKLQTLAGETVMSTDIKYAGGGLSKTLSLPVNTASGIYLLKITSASGDKQIIKVLVNQL